MNRNLTNEEFVNSYLDNGLSDIDRLDFENKLLHDSELREEYNFQNDLVNGIKESRRLELKSRLSNIPINTPLYQTIGFKAVATASITAGLGIGAYFLFTESDNIQLSEIELNQNQITLAEKQEIPSIPEAITPIVEDTSEEIESQVEVITQQKPKNEVMAKNIEVAAEPKIVQPNVIQPNVLESFEPEDIENEDINVDNPINSLDNIQENAENAVEIATIKDKRNKFHYKFFENKLFLLGNFSDMPYEIIELNSSKGKSYFLFYNDEYFKLNQEQVKPAPLMKIENDSLVNELRIIQSNHQ